MHVWLYTLLAWLYNSLHVAYITMIAYSSEDDILRQVGMASLNIFYNSIVIATVTSILTFPGSSYGRLVSTLDN